MCWSPVVRPGHRRQCSGWGECRSSGLLTARPADLWLSGFAAMPRAGVL